VSDSEITERLKGILARPEFQPDAMDAFWRRVRRWGHWFRIWLEGLGPLWRWGITAAAVALLLLILWHLIRGYRDALEAPGSARAGDPGPREAAPPDAARLAALARRLAEQGRLREAARALQQSVFVALCKGAGIPWNPAAGDWEWLEVLRARPELAEFTRRAQALAFGPQPTKEGFEACWARSQAWLESAT
jgi:hypothetical protein